VPAVGWAKAYYDITIPWLRLIRLDSRRCLGRASHSRSSPTLKGPWQRQGPEGYKNFEALLGASRDMACRRRADLRFVIVPDAEASWQQFGPEGRHMFQVRPSPESPDLI
jgi:hypothetical protein